MDRSISNPEIFVETNVLGTVNLCSAQRMPGRRTASGRPAKTYRSPPTRCTAASVPRVFHRSHAAVPAQPVFLPSKASADMFVMAFHDTYGMPVNITRCSNNYGPYQFPGKAYPADDPQCEEP